MAKSTQPEPADWKWLEDTFWCVPSESLAALRLEVADNTLSWKVDQTVWHVTGYRDGYFWGVSATLIRDPGEETSKRGRGSRPKGFVMLGSITPEGRVHLTFTRSGASSAKSATLGIGQAVRHEDSWSLEMQMSTGNRKRTAHWAYMALVTPRDPSWESLPGAGISVPEMLKGLEPPSFG